MFYLSDDIPRTVVVDVFHDVTQQPLQHYVSMLQRVDELVDGLFLHLYVVQTDTQICCQVQFPSQITQYALKEGVDGLYSEIIVVM